MVSQGFFSGSESAEKRRFAGEKENNANLGTKVQPVKLASLNYPTGDLTKPYVPDEVGETIKETEVKRPTYTDSSGNIYDKNPYKSLFSDDDDDTPATFLGRVGDDLNLTQPYNKRLGVDNFRKEQAGYLRSQGYDENTITRLSGDVPRTIGERTQNFFKGLFPGWRDTSEALKSWDVKEMKPYQKEVYDSEYKDFRKDMRDKVFSESSYGEDVERGTIDKPGYYYKDFQQPGVFRSEEDVKSYIKDRGAFMTGMPSNFEGGISGKGEKSDDLTSMYRSTAGDEKTRLEKAKEEQENRNILQRVGDFVGDTFNKLTGTQAAEAGTLQTQGINTSATTNIAQMGGIPIADEIRRDARAMANLRRSGLDKTVGGQSSQPNYGSGRTGGFGTGTHGRGMPSNPAGMRQKGVGVSAGNLSRHKAGPSTSRSGVRGGTTSRSRGGVSRGGSKASSSGSRGQGGGTASRSKGGSFGGSRKSTNTSKSRRRCDIRTKIDIAQLTNTDLFRDDLADVAYFVKEIK